MLKLKIIFFTLLIALDLSTTLISSTPLLKGPNDKDELAKIQQLEHNIQSFETQCYQSNPIDSSFFQQGIANINQLIESYISFHFRFPDSNFAVRALQYLEKMKNLKILYLFNNEKRFNGFWNSSLFEESVKKSHIPDIALIDQMQSTVEISNLQQSFLDDHEAILNYWIHGKQIYVFIIKHDTLQLAQWSAPLEQIRLQIIKLISSFYQHQNLLHLEFDYHLSHELFHYLFQSLEDNLQQQKVIFIIPDDFLIGFPFEILITDTTMNENPDKDIYYSRYRHFSYLTNQYAISYNYSLAPFLLAQNQVRATKKLGHRLLTLSEPIIPKKATVLPNKMADVPAHDLEASGYAADEIKRISRLLFRHDNLKREQVTKKYLNENGNSYRWLYFALPGILDNVDPLQSGLLFSDGKNDSTRLSNWLSPYDAMRMNLSADLLSLSATELTSFNVSGNPGAIALPQSLLFSGVKSLLFSLWRINSISNSQFMSKFYWELKYKRQTNVLALREAKVASLKDTFTLLDKKIARAHPYFWASFMLIGNPKLRPPSPARIPPWGVIIIVYIMVIVISLYITRKTVPKRR